MKNTKTPMQASLGMVKYTVNTEAKCHILKRKPTSNVFDIVVMIH